MEYEPNGPPSSRQAKARFPGALTLSLPAKVNSALGPEIVPLGPPTICVCGDVLSTITARWTLVLFPRTSVATAVSTWAPSATPSVFQMAVPAIVGAGGDGTAVTVRLWPSAARSSLAIPLPSPASTATVTLPRTKAAAAGWRKLSAGGRVSAGESSSTAPMSKRTAPPWTAACGRIPSAVKSASKSALREGGRPRVRGSTPRSTSGEPESGSEVVVTGMGQTIGPVDTRRRAWPGSDTRDWRSHRAPRCRAACGCRYRCRRGSGR